MSFVRPAFREKFHLIRNQILERIKDRMDIIDKAKEALINGLLSIPFIRGTVDYFKSIPTHMVCYSQMFFVSWPSLK